MKRGARRVAILGHVGRPGVRRAASGLKSRLPRLGAEVRVEERLAAEMGIPGHAGAELARWCQVFITLGGDGTVLAGGRLMAGHRGTLLPVNLGGLGFLAAAEAGELDRAVRAALAGEWPVLQRRLLRATVERRGRRRMTGLAMNDVVVKGAGGYAAVHVRMSALGQDLGHLVADGVIAASAAGSTAYSMSAGGPVLAPDVEAMVVTPACAHSLASRPLVLGPDDEIGLRLIGSSDRMLLLLDGQTSIELETRDLVSVRLDATVVRMFSNPHRPFARSLRSKLGWQGSVRRSM